MFGLATAGGPAAVDAPGEPAPGFTAVTLDSVQQSRSLADYRGRGLRIAAISIDDRGNEPLLCAFVADHGPTFDILHARSDIMMAYQVRGGPQRSLVLADGQIVTMCFAVDWMAPANRTRVESLIAGAPGRRWRRSRSLDNFRRLRRAA